MPIIDTSTTALLSMAIDAATLRQQALAQNIANVNTPGYQRLSVNFEERVNALLDGSGQVRAANKADLMSFRPYVQIDQHDGTGNNVSIDTELAAMSENTLHHQVLLKALSKHLALLGTAINEGKR